MNIYVIYKFSDYEIVKKKTEEISQAVPGTCFFFFSPDNKKLMWHHYAIKKIKECNLVAFFDNVDEGCGSLKHIKWELNKAEKYKKRIVVFKINPDLYSTSIYKMDYSDNRINRFKYKVKDINSAVDYFKEQQSWSLEDNLIHKSALDFSNVRQEDKELLLEQYRIMIETSERLMERRQALVNLYITICSALIAFIGASFAFGDLLISAIVCLLSGVVLIVLCNNWRSSLSAYELNNSGKFEVINQIEKYLPAEMFECEYRYNTLNGIKSYSSREKTLPIIFMFFGVSLIFVSLVLFLVNYFN